jgi:hypothetical protein
MKRSREGDALYMAVLYHLGGLGEIPGSTRAASKSSRVKKTCKQLTSVQLSLII